MPSRRALLSALSAGALAGLAGCTSIPFVQPPAIADQSCPPVDLPEDRAVCSHTDAAGDVDVSAEPAAVDTGVEALEPVRLVVENNTDRAYEYRPDRWRLYRTQGFGWGRRGETYGVGDDVGTLSANGGSASWAGIDALFDLGANGATPKGLYAAVLPVYPASGQGESVACTFLFRVADD